MKTQLLCVNEQCKCVGQNGWPQARIVRRGSGSRAEFRGDEIDGVGGVVESHGASTALRLDHFHK
jgi:hypothetical protein